MSPWAARRSSSRAHRWPPTPPSSCVPRRPFVSRGGEKLAAALDAWHVDCGGAGWIDAGCSTGGFTDCLLQRGAPLVYAVDVGEGQLDWRLRGRPARPTDGKDQHHEPRACRPGSAARARGRGPVVPVAAGSSPPHPRPDHGEVGNLPRQAAVRDPRTRATNSTGSSGTRALSAASCSTSSTASRRKGCRWTRDCSRRWQGGKATGSFFSCFVSRARRPPWTPTGWRRRSASSSGRRRVKGACPAASPRSRGSGRCFLRSGSARS